MQEETKNEITPEAAPTEKTVGQHFYFMSNSSALDDGLASAKARNLKVLGWKRSKSTVEPRKNLHGIFVQPSWQAPWIIKCMAPKE